MNRKALVTPIAVSLLALGLASCSDSDDGPGGSLVVGTTDQFEANSGLKAPLDPAYAYDPGSWNLIRQSMQTLVTVPNGGGKPTPEAAQDCSFRDGSSTAYSCRLRKGLTFADGQEVTAEDVRYSIDRVLSLHVTHGPAELLANIDSMEVDGARDITFRLKRADATFPYKLATPTASIVEPSKYPDDRLRRGFEVDGSGPYTLDSTERDGRLVKAVFTRNPGYQGSEEPKNQKVELRPYADAGSMGRALEKGEIDMITRTMTPQQVDRYSSGSHHDINFVEMPSLEIRYLGFNTRADQVDSRAVRAAMAQLVDRNALVNKVYANRAQPLYSLVPTTVTGHDNSFLNSYGSTPDVDRARKLLESAGVRTPVPLTLNYTTDHYGPATKEEFTLLREQLQKGGLFDVTLKGSPWSEFRPALDKRKYSVYGLGWFPDFPDPDNFLAPFLGEDDFLDIGYHNTEIRDELLPREQGMADRTRAVGSLRRIQELVARDVPVIPLWQSKQFLATRSDVRGAEWALNSSSVLQLWELSKDD